MHPAADRRRIKPENPFLRLAGELGLDAETKGGIEMSMRTHLRAMAHSNMAAAGMTHVNKERRYGGQRMPSFFAANWREYIEPPKQAQRKRAACRAQHSKGARTVRS